MRLRGRSSPSERQSREQLPHAMFEPNDMFAVPFDQFWDEDFGAMLMGSSDAVFDEALDGSIPIL